MNDEQLSKFLDQGYLVITPDGVSDSVHDQLFSQAAEAYVARRATRDRQTGVDFIGDNIVSDMPALESILGAKNVHETLVDIVGDDYFRYGHSFIHESATFDQGFHKDSHLPWSLRGALRSHRPNWAMAFYYPQDTTIEMGATRILPGSQYWNVDHEIDGHTVGEDRLDYGEKALYTTLTPSGRDQRLAETVSGFDPRLESVAVEVKKGSVVIVHFDLIHRGARNDSDKERFMFKFWFTRTTAPRTGRRVAPPADADPRRLPVLHALDHWFDDADKPVDQPTAFETPANEAQRVARAYVLGMRGDPALLAELTSEIESTRRAAMYGLTAFGEDAIPAALPVALHALDAAHMGVRKSAAFLLGELAVYKPEIFERLVGVLSADSSDEVRSCALVAITRITRQALARGNVELVLPMIAIIRSCADATRERDYPGTLYPMNPIRQYAALALLTTATESIRTQVDQAMLEAQLELASRIAEQESDRYARDTARETLKRLRRAGLSAT